MVIIPAIYKNNVKYGGSSSSLDIVTKLDSTVTDNQVPSAKVVYDLIENNKYEEVASGDANMLYEQGKTKTYIVMSANKDNIVNLPNTLTSGFTMISISNSGCHQFIFTSKNEIYKRNGSYNGTTVTFNNPWQKVCTTTVADVALTQLTVNSWCSHGSARYTVRNGVCYVDIDSLVSSTMSTSSQVIISGLPIPLIQSWHSLGANSSATSTPVQNLLVLVKANGDLVNHIGTDNAEYYGTFCYPVAE